MKAKTVPAIYNPYKTPLKLPPKLLMQKYAIRFKMPVSSKTLAKNNAPIIIQPVGCVQPLNAICWGTIPVI